MGLDLFDDPRYRLNPYCTGTDSLRPPQLRFPFLSASLNPYCTGTDSLRKTKQDFLDTYDFNVLILIVLEQTL